MKCRQGGMAMIVRSQADNIGKVVTCLELMGSDLVVQLGNIKFRLGGGPWWRVDRNLNLIYGDSIYEEVIPFARDEAMMPIEGEGEKQENKKEQYA